MALLCLAMENDKFTNPPYLMQAPYLWVAYYKIALPTTFRLSNYTIFYGAHLASLKEGFTRGGRLRS